MQIVGFSREITLIDYGITNDPEKFVTEIIGISMKYLYWNVPFYVVLNLLLIMRNSLQALGNKKLPVIASVVELTGKFGGALLLSRMVGYLGICLTEPITWLICVPIASAGFVQKLKQTSKI